MPGFKRRGEVTKSCDTVNFGTRMKLLIAGYIIGEKVQKEGKKLAKTQTARSKSIYTHTHTHMQHSTPPGYGDCLGQRRVTRGES